MPIQPYIVQALQDPDYGSSTITPPSGLSGQGEQTVLPAGADLHLYYATDLDLEIKGGGSSVFLYKCTLNRLYTNPGTHVVAVDCYFTNRLYFNGTTGEILGTQVDWRKEDLAGSMVELVEPYIEIYGQSRLKFNQVNFQNMRNFIYMEDSNLHMVDCRSINQFEDWALQGYHSRLKLDRCFFVSWMKLIELQDGSFIDISSCHLKGQKDMCLALSGTQGTITDCQALTSPDGFIPDEPVKDAKGLYGAGAVIRASGGSRLQVKDTNLVSSDYLHDWGVKADLGSTVDFFSSTGQNSINGGFLPAIECAGTDSRVSVFNYELIISADDAAIYAYDNGVVEVSNGDSITSASKEGIRCKSGGKVTVQQFREIVGKTYGIYAEDTSVVRIVDIDERIEGESESGVYIDASSLFLKDVEALTGNTYGADGVNGSSATFISVRGITGTSNDGLRFTEACRVLYRNSIDLTDTFVLGRNYGIYLESSALLLRYCNSIKGEVEDGVYAATSRAVLKYIDEIYGETNGIQLLTGSDLELRTVTSVAGGTEYSVYADDDCSGLISEVNLFYGVKGCVVYQTNNRFLHVNNCETFRAIAGPGIWFEGKQANITDITLIETLGDSDLRGNGLVLAGCDAIVSDITKIDAFWVGFSVEDHLGRRSSVRATAMPFCSGLNSPHGLDVINSTFYGDNLSLLLDVIVSNADVTFKRTVVNGAIVGNSCSLNLDACFVNGHIHLTDSSYDFLNTTGDGEQKNFNSSGVTRNYVQNATFEELPGASSHVNMTLNGQLILDSGSATSVSKGIFAVGVTVTESSLELQKVEVAGELTATGSSIVLDSSSISGKATLASTCSLRALTSIFSGGLDGPDSDIDLAACDIAAVTVNQSRLRIGASNSGAITATNSSVHSEASTLGGIILTGSALVAQAGDLGAVDLTSSAADLLSTSATVNGLSVKSSIPVSPGFAVKVGTGKRYEAFDDEVRAWYLKSFEAAIYENLRFNVGNTSGDFEVRVDGNAILHTSGSYTVESDDTIEYKSDFKVQRTGPVLSDIYAPFPASPENPQDPGF